MKKDKIRSISLNKFRGATKPLEIHFDPKKSMIMIFGENGTGKSTLVDAMDFIFNKECGSLKEKSSTNIKSHLPSLGSTSQDIKISISSQTHKWAGKLNGSHPKIKGDENYFSVGILRRDKILKLVNAEPSQRYEALKNFIELFNIRSSESSLRKCINSIGTDLNGEVSGEASQNKTLKQYWEKEGRPEDSYLKWAEKESKKEAPELRGKISQYDQCVKIIKKYLESRNQFEESKTKMSEKEKQYSEAHEELKEIEKKVQGQSKETIGILKETLSFLKKKDSNECPVCEQPIDPKNLKERISIRLKEMRELAVSTENWTKIKKEYDSLQADLSQNKQKFTTSIKSVIKFWEDENTIAEIKKIKKDFIEDQFLLEDQMDLEKEKFFFDRASLALKDSENTLGKDTKSLNQLNLIKTSWKNLKETQKKIQKLDSKKAFLNKVLETVETERKTYTENILKAISQDVETLYSKLHPEEGLSNIKIYLNPRHQGSLEIKSNFQNKTEVPPQAYFSDSHLDTLGICVFIAMAKYFKNDIIVLDDVLTSVDQPHIERFIQILHGESKHFNQIILTTHYRPWREKYKFSRQPSSNVQLIELSSFWSIEQGIKSNETKLSIEELEILKEQIPFDRQTAGSKAGVFLESLLDHITLLYALPAPRKPESVYTLGELITCFSKKFINNMEIQYDAGNKIPLLNIMNGLFQITEPIRNKVGCHWNDIGMHFSDHEVMSFLNKTVAFGKMLICKQCGGLPQKKKSDCWKCGCSKTSLYPLSK